MLKKIKDWLYRVSVESNANVRYFHQKYASSMKSDGSYSRVKSLLYLLKLTLVIRILRSKKYREHHFAKPYALGAESELSYKSPEKFAEKLLDYDIISFDVFDTLVFRPFGEPTGLFYLVGQKLEYLDFVNIRVHAEHEVRSLTGKNKKRRNSSREINIYEIYDYLERYCGIDAKTGVETEFQTELDLIFANEFMKKVYEILVANGKKIIAVTDMYLTKDMIKQILDNCGYTDIAEIFVSCEHREGKHNGKLFKTVKKKLGENLRYIHIGDNWLADFEQPKKHGFTAVHYENVNQKGNMYRIHDMSAIVSSAWRGIVNAHLHNGLHKFSMAYEYGFTCGGLFVLGYCNFIRRYAQTNRIEKILFLSRDGEILKKVYGKLFPENNSEYVYWSRNAAAKLGSDKYKYDYFRRFIHHKIDSVSPAEIAKIFQAMELSSLLPPFLKKYKLSVSARLDSKNAEKIIEYLTENWNKVQEIYAGENEAAKRYYTNIIGDCKKVCTIDIGWAGSGGVILAHLLKDVWKLGCESYTLVAGTNTFHNYEPNMSESVMQSGQMSAYLYSQSHNRNLFYIHNPNEMHNVFFEFLLSSKSASLKGFSKSGPVFAKENHDNDEIISDIQAGILDFVNIYTKRFKKYDYMLTISGSDAYAPFRHLTADNNKYFRKLFENIYFDIGVGDDKKARIFRF